MGKRYYCDYCDRSFIDDLEARKKHLNGSMHMRLRKEHYDSFRGKLLCVRHNTRIHYLIFNFKIVNTCIEMTPIKTANLIYLTDLI